ncbi:unnamed protein product [Candidula unifasciata]|uniref:G-protein coupled receptors family 3 profile domain-containing protein n=1 Tax=Candidula unifasciata TaxID=100452 RepID=A0A8S3ZV68_9EUPU|nr:unnamed protein product [Candidula unifasciata]
MTISKPSSSRSSSTVSLLISIFYWFSRASCQSCVPQAIPDIDQRTYSSIGDINIGVFISASPSGGPAACLNISNPGSSVLEHSEAIAYAVRSVNQDPDLLPNIKLGFIQVDDCGNENVALAAALSFFPRVIDRTGNMESCFDNSAAWMYQQDNKAMPFYDVVGVIGPSASQRMISVSKLFASARIPVIGCLASSDELSDKSRHPYFSRLIPPDKYQVGAMMQFIQRNGWSYISVVYVKDSYGQKGYDHIKETSMQYGICLASAQRVGTDADFDTVISELLTYPRARVVILFLYSQSSGLLVNSVNKFNASGHFILIWSDAWNTAFKRLPLHAQDSILGSFSVGLYSTYIPQYLEYLRHLRVHNTTNPWLKSQWEYLANCSLDSYESCDSEFDILTSDRFEFEKTPSLYIDAVYAFAHALHNLLSDLCPYAKGAEARRCIQGDVLLGYLRNISFDGHNGHIQFDEFGDRKGKYEIREIVRDYKIVPFVNRSSIISREARTVAVYDVETDRLNFTEYKINWDYVKRIERMTQLPEDSPFWGIPESVCSIACRTGEFRIQREPYCCWDCRKCRDNEKVSFDGTSCDECDLLTWPDKASGYTSCTTITPTYPLVKDTIPLILTCLGLFALICVTLVVIGYIYFRNSRIIKASSRELSISQMVAIYVGYITIIIFQTPPTHESCGAAYFLFCFSFALLYAPLLHQNNTCLQDLPERQEAQPTTCSNQPYIPDGHGRNSPSMSGMYSNIKIIVFKMVLCLIIYIVFRPTAQAIQPIPTEKFVELSCDMTSPGLASFLVYNLVLVFLCSIFAFKTRKLPDNFNESKFISMCVATTLVIWLAFVPTYFTANRNSVRIMLLSIALLLNHTVALIFLFVPKLYAAAYLPTENFATSRFQAGEATTGVHKSSFSNRIMPSPEPDPFTAKFGNDVHF